MAMLDYGSVVKKNGIIIQDEFFMDMEKAVGFKLDKAKRKKQKIKYDENTNRYIEYGEIEESFIEVDGSFFSYMGDEELLVCVYKGLLIFISNGEVIRTQYDLNLSNEVPYRAQRLTFYVNGIQFEIKRLYDNNRYLLRFWYKENLYECIYGYGVDIDKDVWYGVSSREREYINKWFNCKTKKAV